MNWILLILGIETSLMVFFLNWGWQSKKKTAPLILGPFWQKYIYFWHKIIISAYIFQTVQGTVYSVPYKQGLAVSGTQETRFRRFWSAGNRRRIPSQKQDTFDPSSFCWISSRRLERKEPPKAFHSSASCPQGFSRKKTSNGPFQWGTILQSAWNKVYFKDLFSQLYFSFCPSTALPRFY